MHPESDVPDTERGGQVTDSHFTVFELGQGRGDSPTDPTRNEAAERLAISIVAARDNWPKAVAKAEEALAAEHRATVERIESVVDGWYVGGMLTNKAQIGNVKAAIRRASGVDQEAAR